MRKCLALILSPVMAFSMLTLRVGASSQEFTDMPTDWSAAALKAAVEKGLLQGSDGRLNPGQNMTRAEMAVIISPAFGAVTASDLSGFSDVPKNEWFAPWIAKVVAMKAMTGDGIMRPNAPLPDRNVSQLSTRY